MKRLLQHVSTPIAAALLLWAPTAFGGAATPGINLSWDDCGAAGVADKSRLNCAASDAGNQTFYGSMVAPVGITWSAAQFWVGFVSSTPAIPAWWTIGTVPNCRSTSALTINHITPCNTATDYLENIPGLVGGSQYTVNPAVGNRNEVPGPNHATINALAAVDNTQATPINAGEEYYVFSCRITNASSTTCAGCDVPMCILWNGLEIFEPETRIFDAPVGGRNFVTFQGGAGANCAEVPVKNKTWGEIKSIYR